jgi:hypothetical protein
MHTECRIVRYLTKAEALELGGSEGEFSEEIRGYCKDTITDPGLKRRLLAAKLAEFEAIQLIDSPPKNILCLQLVIEEMEERFSEEELNGMLELFRQALQNKDHS